MAIPAARRSDTDNDQSLCASLTDRELGELNALGHRQAMQRGETLIWAGDDSVICANLISGVLKLTASTADGREQIVGLLYPDDFVGRLYPGLAHFTVTALTEAELRVYPRAPFQRVLEDHVEMERLLLRRTMVALDEARARMLMLARGTAFEKVAGFLVGMAARARVNGGGVPRDRAITIDLPLSRGQIADVLGLTIETVSRQMTRLRAAGLLALPGGRTVTILDVQALAALSEAC